MVHNTLSRESRLSSLCKMEAQGRAVTGPGQAFASIEFFEFRLGRELDRLDQVQSTEALEDPINHDSHSLVPYASQPNRPRTSLPKILATPLSQFTWTRYVAAMHEAIGSYGGKCQSRLQPVQAILSEGHDAMPVMVCVLALGTWVTWLRRQNTTRRIIL
eukprot:1842879-Amphidinium_carterae.1